MSNIFDLFKKISKDNESIPGPVTHIVVGLGNPGTKYIKTRHNAGFMFMSYFAQKQNININRLKFKALTKEIVFANKHILVMLPQTFMNRSGEALREAADFYKIKPENIIVIYDDVSLPCGKMRIRRKGSDGGHNGIKSIIEYLNTDEFPRIKLGVGAPPKGAAMVDWVLGDIPKNEQQDFYTCIEKSYDALELILSDNMDKAMNLYN